MGANAALFPVTRDQAMRVPAVAAARDLICLQLASGALRQYRGAELVAKQPAWLYRTDSDVAPQIRALWTWDDLLFSGFSLWRRFNDSKGQIGDAVRVPVEQWDWDENFNVLLDGEPVRPADVILFTGWNEGLLLNASDAIKQALAISDAVTTRVNNPVPHTLLKEEMDLGLSDGSEDPEDNDQQKYVDSFAAARRNRTTGAVSYMPYGLTAVEYGTGGIELYEQGRNAAVLDIARHAGVPASLLEANSVSSSLTYETQRGNRSILNDRLRNKALVMDARLSMDDVTPRGTRVAVDLSHLIDADDGLPATTED